MEQRDDPPSPAPSAPKRRRVQQRARAWLITFNDRLERDPSSRWREDSEEKKNDEDRFRADAAAHSADEEEEEAGEGAAADARSPRRHDGEVGDRIGHFRHPTEVLDGLRGATHLSYFVGQLERGPENGEFAVHACPC